MRPVSCIESWDLTGFSFYSIVLVTKIFESGKSVGFVHAEVDEIAWISHACLRDMAV